MTDMTHREAAERVNEGLRAASDCARQLKKLQGNPAWDDIARHLNGLAFKAKQIYDKRALTYKESMQLLDQYQLENK